MEVWILKTASLSQLRVLNLSGSKSKCFGSVPQSPPKVRTPWVLRGWTSARLRLWCCIKNTQEMPAGTLRKVSGSEPFRTACTHWMDAVLNVKDLEALDRPLATAVCQTREEEGEGRSPSISWLSRLSFCNEAVGEAGLPRILKALGFCLGDPAKAPRG